MALLNKSQIKDFWTRGVIVISQAVVTSVDAEFFMLWQNILLR
jgi:hypothetical protein